MKETVLRLPVPCEQIQHTLGHWKRSIDNLVPNQAIQHADVVAAANMLCKASSNLGIVESEHKICRINRFTIAVMKKHAAVAYKGTAPGVWQLLFCRKVCLHCKEFGSSGSFLERAKQLGKRLRHLCQLGVCCSCRRGLRLRLARFFLCIGIQGVVSAYRCHGLQHSRKLRLICFINRLRKHFASRPVNAQQASFAGSACHNGAPKANCSQEQISHH
mmetsp:Transcript_58883/g.140494  ORF Transcript_58883/g.140494 Transcript_58883/m.140494 type:complete len:217 (+) Transcript_58883:440-1090(+)